MENYQQDFWDTRAKDGGLYAIFTHRWTASECDKVHRAQASALFSMLPSLDDLDVLDLGCGIGRLSKPLQDRAGSVVGLDFSAAMVSRAQATIPGVPFVQASADYLCFSANSFDVVVASFIFQHILDETRFQRALQECARILRSDGYLICIDGIAEVASYPDNSKVTRVRTLNHYTSNLSPAMALQQQAPLICIQDQYTIMLWKKSGYPT